MNTRGAARVEPVPGREAHDPAVLEKPPDDALHPDVFGEPRDPGAKGADPAHDEVDRDTGLRGPVEVLDDPPVHQGVELGHDAGRPAGPRVLDLRVDELGQALAHVQRRDRELLEPVRGRGARHVVEELGRVAAQGPVAG